MRVSIESSFTIEESCTQYSLDIYCMISQEDPLPNVSIAVSYTITFTTHGYLTLIFHSVSYIYDRGPPRREAIIIFQEPNAYIITIMYVQMYSLWDKWLRQYTHR